jgi:hypothetical protein
MGKPKGEDYVKLLEEHAIKHSLEPPIYIDWSEGGIECQFMDYSAWAWHEDREEAKNRAAKYLWDSVINVSS